MWLQSQEQNRQRAEKFFIYTRDSVREELHRLKLLTQDCGFSAELLRQVGPFGQAVQVPLQDVPAHLIVEGEAELGMNLKTGIKLLLNVSMHSCYGAIAAFLTCQRLQSSSFLNERFAATARRQISYFCVHMQLTFGSIWYRRCRLLPWSYSLSHGW